MGSTYSQGGKSWQAFGERKKIRSILSSGVYLLIYNKNVVSVRITRIATKNVIFVGIQKIPTKNIVLRIFANTWEHKSIIKRVNHSSGAFQTDWKLSRLAGNFTDWLETF